MRGAVVIVFALTRSVSFYFQIIMLLCDQMDSPITELSIFFFLRLGKGSVTERFPEV